MSVTPESFDTVFRTANPVTSVGVSKVTVVITCYKYGDVCLEALQSLEQQTEYPVDIVLIDDCSPDDSIKKITPWFEKNNKSEKFGKLELLRHCGNQGLSKSRNTAISRVETPYIFILDADNSVYPRALNVLREALENSEAAMAYSLTEVFGGKRDIVGNSVWLPEKFAFGNYIDAMAMVRTAVFQQLGGYRVMPNKFGWEDFDFWCKMVDAGLKGCHVPQILCRYRSHSTSMVNTETRNFVQERLHSIKRDFEKHHKMTFNF